MEKAKRYRDLMCKLTTSEFLDRGKKLASTMDKIDQAKAEFDAIKQRHKTNVEVLTQLANDLAQIVRDGQEERPVEITEDFDYSNGIAITVRVDTGEVLGQRGLTDDERQTTLLDSLSGSHQ